VGLALSLAMLNLAMLNLAMLNLAMLNLAMLNLAMLNLAMLNLAMLNLAMLNLGGFLFHRCKDQPGTCSRRQCPERPAVPCQVPQTRSADKK
jgi:hypothetical protein